MTLLIDDHDRYAGMQLIPWWEQRKLRAAKIMVVGAGALGNEVLKNLALVGVGQIIVVDCDHIEAGNLTRSVLYRASDCGHPKAEVAARAVREMNPDVQVVPVVGNVITDVGLGLFREMDVVIGCLDNREARLWVNRACWRVSRPWIDGGIQEISGVAKVFAPPDSACYECAMTENDYRLINLRYSCPLLPREDILAGKVPTAPTIAAIVAGLQTQEALKLIHGLPVEAGTAMVFNGVANNFYKTRYQRREDCLSHEQFGDSVDLPFGACNSATELFVHLRSMLEMAGPLTLVLERDLVESVYCEACEIRTPILRPAFEVAARHANCPSCGSPSKPEICHLITDESPLARHSLLELGIPRYDLVRVRNRSDEMVGLLAQDQQQVWGGHGQ